MSYFIEDLKKHELNPGVEYLLDSNIWIKILAPRNKPSQQDEDYIAFFERLIETKGCSIVVPALIFSEVVNRLLRDIHLPKFKREKQIQGELPKDFFKNVFRASSEYKIAYSLISDDFKAYHSNITIVNDGFGDTVKLKYVLPSKPDFNLDFNDSYFYFLAKKRNYIIVTDDKDFWVKEVKVVTLNAALLNKLRKK